MRNVKSGPDSTWRQALPIEVKIEILDLNHRPPGPEDWSHEESITYTEYDEMRLGACKVPALLSGYQHQSPNRSARLVEKN
jgi:hypothetical protein